MNTFDRPIPRQSLGTTLSHRVNPPISILVLGLLFAVRAAAQTPLSVTTPADLVTALNTVSSNPSTSYTVTFTGSITLNAPATLPAINTSSPLIINGAGNTLDGGGVQRGFFVYAGTVLIENLTIQNTLARGGTGGIGANGSGGGGAGLGGALFVASGAHVTVSSVTFGSAGNPNSAIGGFGGGTGTGFGAGGGGGLGGNGGSNLSGLGGSAGGGGLGLGANGGAQAIVGGAGIGVGAASAGSGTGGGGAAGGIDGGGGGGQGGGNGSGGGVAGGAGGGGTGGNGGFGGGGGGAFTSSDAGSGGFGGGGGGGLGGATGGNGGFGGGGGSVGSPAGGNGGFGGGNGSVGTASGGGGLGAGGAIFVASGGFLVVDGIVGITGNSVTAGASGGGSAIAGSSFGPGIFLQGNDASDGGAGTLTFAPSVLQTQTITDIIADQTGSGGTGAWAVAMSGAGTLDLIGDNTFSGGVTVTGGILEVNNGGGSATGTGPVSIGSGATVNGTGSIAGSLTALAGSTIVPGAGIGNLTVGGNVTWNSTATVNCTLGINSSVSSRLVVAGSLLAGGSGPFQFNFQNSGSQGLTYTLATFASTSFTGADFSFTNLGTGLGGTFAIVGGTSLQFTTAAAPAVTSSGNADGTIGSAFTYTITANNSPTSFSVTGTLPPGLALSTATGVISGVATQVGIFPVTIGATGTGGTFTETLTITIGAIGQILNFSVPPNQSTTSGPLVLPATTGSGLPVTYTVLSGPATVLGTTVTFTGTSGLVTIQVNQAGNATTQPATTTFTISVLAPNALINLSGRGMVTASQALISGFVVGGSGPKQVLVRGVGPALAGLGVADALAAPVLQLFDGNGNLLLTNNGWGNNSMLSAAFAQVGAFGFAANSLDTAAVATLQPGAYTVVVTGMGGTSGVALAEVYDMTLNPLLATQRLVNISTRSLIGTGSDILIAGFVISGNVPKQVLIRGDGPALGAFGVTTALSDPFLSLFDSNGTLVAENDNWGSPLPLIGTPATPDAIATAGVEAGAFALQPGSTDSAILVTLAPGSYTAQVSGVAGATGVGLVEIYEIP